MNILELPIERQKEIAKRKGKSLEQWRNDARKVLEKMEEHCRVVDSTPPFKFSSPEREEEVRKRTGGEWQVSDIEK